LHLAKPQDHFIDLGLGVERRCGHEWTVSLLLDGWPMPERRIASSHANVIDDPPNHQTKHDQDDPRFHHRAISIAILTRDRRDRVVGQGWAQRKRLTRRPQRPQSRRSARWPALRAGWIERRARKRAPTPLSLLPPRPPRLAKTMKNTAFGGIHIRRLIVGPVPRHRRAPGDRLRRRSRG
jgi:hypothetical protein